MSVSASQGSKFLCVDIALSNVIQPIRITNSNVQKFEGADVFNPHPLLSVDLPELQATLPSDGASMTVATHLADFARLIKQARAFYSPIKVRIREIATEHDSPDGVLIRHFNGEISSHASKDGLTTLRLSHCFSGMDSETGFVITPECVATFGDQHSCTVLVESLKESGTIVGYDGGRKITITGLPLKQSFFWMPGKVRDSTGLTTGIHFHQTGLEFEMRSLIPVAWRDVLGQGGTVPVEVLPGCRRITADCRMLNPKPYEFKGLGAATPDRHPILEVIDEA